MIPLEEVLKKVWDLDNNPVEKMKYRVVAEMLGIDEVALSLMRKRNNGKEIKNNMLSIVCDFCVDRGILINSFLYTKNTFKIPMNIK